MKLYEFTLKFSFPDEDFIDDIDELVERLGEAGGDDALVGIGKTGRLALDFFRRLNLRLTPSRRLLLMLRPPFPRQR